ncbi:flagellar basal body rod protein FlgB [Alkaliphilus serpentinus]|uniref:Flagellar basal body rod protein FlgB n=1 Tax=Alkaliphilus serpentinus TaxID=1482731 RepID=A0A833HQ24_9FIRM|nr:flagellar basal body rod protein FlgB [Alkaliphilus serpentinus]KAB3531390.1 flagellar basal body rod protein FlgB [Alkaliphilus serpentinus]
MFKNINLLESALNASWKRNEVISNNIANANTPNFKKSSVEFEEALAAALNKKNIIGNTTHEKHFKIGQSLDGGIQHKVKEESHYSTRRDGNNVDIDVEMADLAKNSILYNTLTSQLNLQLQRIKSVINEGK